ncbi:hypothetical protein FQN57_006422 [Myotisia sp. PD_48]|nr:hypothetical protein FQN57_006422 [Myotisia sp. PD_48]
MVVYVDHSQDVLPIQRLAGGSVLPGTLPAHLSNRGAVFAVQLSTDQSSSSAMASTSAVEHQIHAQYSSGNALRVDEKFEDTEPPSSRLNGIMSKLLSCYPQRDRTFRGSKYSNCTMKYPSTTALQYRLRRLCTACLAAPLRDHGLIPRLSNQETESQSEADILQSHPQLCSCVIEYWYCRPCGQHLTSDDTMYKRVWSWRTRYNTYLGGGGPWVSFGDGGHGVQCGRRENCLGAEKIEVEVDCNTEDFMSGHPDRSHAHYSHDHSHDLHLDSHDDEEPGYLRQEIVGIGGVVKHKVKKHVKVGANVVELHNELGTSNNLVQERLGAVRSCCGWCLQIVPSTKELLQLLH